MAGAWQLILADAGTFGVFHSNTCIEHIFLVYEDLIDGRFIVSTARFLQSS